MRAPPLRPGQIVILDNLSAHQSARIQHVVAARPGEGWCLPSYSRDLAPIEPAFAKLKPAWRKADARTVEARYDTISTS